MLLALVAPLFAELPLPTWPECGEPDRPDLCPSDLGTDWALLSYVPSSWQSNLRPEELTSGTGLSADRAWRTTTGRTDVVIAVLDSGILWDDTSLRTKHYLHRAELPLPQIGDTTAADYDANGDTVFNIDDYAQDPRVSMDAGVDVADSMLDPSDLIHTFSDGVDDDGNGYIDDISGWDFFWNDNDPYDDTRYDHGTYEAQESMRPGNDGDGIGVCPNCMALSLRVGDSFVADVQNFATAATYAVDNGAAVIQEALGTLSNSTYAMNAIDYAWDNDVLVVGSAADETAYHPNPPGANPHTLYVHAIRYDGDDADQATSFLAYSNCTNHGARLDLSAPSTGCSSGATAMTAGVAGLTVSAAWDVGVELSASELYQLLVQTADDIHVAESVTSDQWYPSYAGWDRYFGYGRVNAASAVEAVAALAIPPEADLESPAWYAYYDPSVTPTLTVTGLARAERGVLASWELAWAPGLEPADADYTTLASGSEPVDGELYTWDISDLPDFDPAARIPDHTLGMNQVDREDAVNIYSVSLRLTVTDLDGNKGQMRRVFYIHEDPDLMDGFPVNIGASLESSPKLYDLDGDGSREIIIADGDGRLHVINGAGAELPGFPVRLSLLEELDPTHAANHLSAPGYAVVGSDHGAPVIGSPAVGDLDGDGAAEIIVGTLRGSLHVISRDGTERPGFPVYQGEVTTTSSTQWYDEGFFSAPALADLDGDGAAEIVVGGMDQYVYAFEADGSAVAGWPVRLAVETTVGNRIVAPPAVGDLDKDGKDDVVVGTNEVVNGNLAVVWAVSGAGSVLPGWPINLYSLYVDALPYVGEGMPNGAALADLDGDGALEVVVHGLAGNVSIYDAGGTLLFDATSAASGYGAGSNLSDNSMLPLINSPSIGDLNGDGTPDIASAGAGIGYATALLSDGDRADFDHAMGAWSGIDGSFLPGFPRQMEDLPFFLNPAIADIDGDQAPEVIGGTGGFLLHAWDAEGSAPANWPKFTGQWLLGSPAVGALTGDGTLDVVAGTRGGLLFAWNTPSPSGATVTWAAYGHDPANTRNHEAPLDGYNAGYPAEDCCKAEPEPGCGCSTGGAGGGWVIGLGALALLRRRAV